MGKKDKNTEVLTRGTKKIITNAIEKTGEFNRSIISDEICNELFEKFPGDSLEYQLKRMNLTTIKDIQKAVDTYMFRHVKSNKNSKEEELDEK